MPQKTNAKLNNQWGLLSLQLYEGAMNKYEMKKNILPSTIYFVKVQVKLHGLLKNIYKIY
jgi:hypothetical protein